MGGELTLSQGRSAANRSVPATGLQDAAPYITSCKARIECMGVMCGLENREHVISKFGTS